MRQNKEVKRNNGFRRAFIAGSLIIVILSLLISWATISIIRGLEKKLPNEETSKVDQNFESSGLDKDTVFIEKVKEVRKIDTVYKYVYPTKPKSEESSITRRDTSAK